MSQEPQVPVRQQGQWPLQAGDVLSGAWTGPGMAASDCQVSLGTGQVQAAAGELRQQGKVRIIRVQDWALLQCK